MSQKILICGASGQLGSALREALQQAPNRPYQVYGTFNRTIPSLQAVPSTETMEEGSTHLFPLEVRDKSQVEALLQKINPDIVINTTSLTHVDNCELQQQEAYDINVMGNKNLLEGVESLRPLGKPARFVYISTYYVFDGTAGSYRETDETRPLNYYGKTKLWAEQDCQHYPGSLIIRTSKIFSLGRDQRNFLARLHSALLNNLEMKQVTDQYTNPVLVESLAEAIVQLILNNKQGMYHAGGKDTVSNYQFAVQFAEFWGFNTKLIKAVATEELQQPAPRPKRCALTVHKLEQENIKLWTLPESFQYLKQRKGL